MDPIMTLLFISTGMRRSSFAATLHGLTIKPEDEPGILLEATWDKNGDVDRQSFLGEVVDGKQKIVEILPTLTP